MKTTHSPISFTKKAIQKRIKRNKSRIRRGKLGKSKGSKHVG